VKTLFLGGARSGKSRIAQAAAEAYSGRLTYLATGQAGDAEMAARIAHHRADRGPRWHTVECPVALADAVAAVPDGTVMIDCLTLWLTNLMLGGHDIARQTGALRAALAATRCRVMIVSNEVGLGIVPEHPLGRAFRDEAGRLNQDIAAAADRVFFVAAGLVLPLAAYPGSMAPAD
jgi:adenosylcobinamide kinase / adenosylcobinamide-phosphate guanylyltransferase